jgi:hypothetical protein
MHQRDVIANSFAHGSTIIRISLGINDNGIVGMQLERLIAHIYTSQSLLSNCFRRCPTLRTGVGEYLVTVCPQQLIDRQIGCLAGNIPEADINLSLEELGWNSVSGYPPYLLPDGLTIDRVLADNHWPDDVLNITDYTAINRRRESFRTVALDTFVS